MGGPGSSPLNSHSAAHMEGAVLALQSGLFSKCALHSISFIQFRKRLTPHGAQLAGRLVIVEVLSHNSLPSSAFPHWQ